MNYDLAIEILTVLINDGCILYNMNKTNELHNNSNNKLMTISLTRKNYEKLKRQDYTSESFNDVVSRFLENVKEERNKVKRK